jgi:branched-chain amino acid transport system ATP-binding protein
VEAEVILRVEKIRKGFGGVVAASNISFDLRKGEFVGLIGPNGSGKTTLVNLITGFVKPDGGRVLFKGRDLTGMMPYTIAELGVARTFQMVRMFYNLPAYKNVIIPLCSGRVKARRGGRYGERDDMAVELLDEYGFERDSMVPYKMAHSLPHGYLKRLDLARAMALRPEVLLLDELFSGMSMSEVAATLPMLERLNREGVSILMVEHRLKELFKVADRVIVLNFGEKIAEGPPAEVMKTEAVRSAYLGSEFGDERTSPPADRTDGQKPAVQDRRGEKMLEVRDLSVYYENALAINSLHLEVGRGELVAVLGSNSGGKTTLMNTISGLILDMQKKENRRGGERIHLYGRILFRGKDVTAMGPCERVRMGLVLCRERHPVFRDSSVLENLRIAGNSLKGPEARRTLESILEIFPRLKSLERRRGGLLSGGEQQMLAVGMALMTRPALLLLDEPLLGLSPLLQQTVAGAMKSISRGGMTLLVAEQFARPLLPVIDRGYVIENGILVMSGTRDELEGDPEVRASYLGV